MKITKQHFDLIASILSSSQPEAPPHNTPEHQRYWQGRRHQFKRTVEQFIEVLSQHNANFKEDIFREAAYKDWTTTNTVTDGISSTSASTSSTSSPAIGEHDEESE